MTDTLIGKKIRITDNSGCDRLFLNGDLAVIIAVDEGGDYWADFANMGNDRAHTHGSDAVWCVGPNNMPQKYFEVIDEQTTATGDK